MILVNENVPRPLLNESVHVLIFKFYLSLSNALLRVQKIEDDCC